jgi:sugar diacid utilization regulator
MKQNLRTREWLEITDAKQAAILLEAKTLQFLTPFVGTECSADEAAALLNVNLNTLLYQIKRLRKFKLLQLVRT